MIQAVIITNCKRKVKVSFLDDSPYSFYRIAFGIRNIINTLVKLQN